MSEDVQPAFDKAFAQLTGYDALRWQRRLFAKHFRQGVLPSVVDVPTGLGKTAVMALWLIARADGAALPRRLVYVVDRRAVVDQATEFAERLRQRLQLQECRQIARTLGLDDRLLPISTLRGQHVDNREWLEDPSLPAIIVGTVDMIGSRLLFEGYGVSRKMRPYHAGLLGADTLVLLDEAHLVPPFEALLATIANGQKQFGPSPSDQDHGRLLPSFTLLPLSATARNADAQAFRLKEEDYQAPDGTINCEETHRRLTASKHLNLVPVAHGKLVDELASQAWTLTDEGRLPIRVIVYCDRREEAEKVKATLDKRSAPTRKGQPARADTELFVGARRVRERQRAAERLKSLGYLAGEASTPTRPAFLVATSAAEVGVDLDGDHMVCDLVTWERMVQRLGRVNRRGNGSADVVVVCSPPERPEITAPSPPAAPPIEPIKPTSLPKGASKAARDSHSLEKKQYTNAEKAYQAARKKYDKDCADYEKAKTKFDEAWAPYHAFETKEKAVRLLDGDASPAAIRLLLARDATHRKPAPREVLAAASEPPPLRPALTRPLVDAWSMTSLSVHTARPEVDPWLRGWVDDLPQTTLLWRARMPVRPSISTSDKEIEDFFEAAPPHASELLETETFRVCDWLMNRAKALRERVPEPAEAIVEDESRPVRVMTTEDDDTPNTFATADRPEGDESTPTQSPPPRLHADDVVGIVLSGGGRVERRYRLRELAAEQKDLRKHLESVLKGRTLVLEARFGGLSADGLLDPKAGPAAETPDETGRWPDAPAGASPSVPFRVRLLVSEAAAGSDPDWHPADFFVLERNAEGEPLRWLQVESWRADPTTEDARSTGPDQTLAEHQSWAERRARTLAQRLGLPKPYEDMLAIAAGRHDEGKRAPRWQEASRAPRQGGPYAKTRGPFRAARLEGYRHEFGSLPFAASDSGLRALPEDLQDLALHLIAAHHGFSRPVIAVDGCDDAPPSQLQARAQEVALRFARLQKRWGPWGLAWWEALLRAADQQASRENDERGRKQAGGN